MSQRSLDNTSQPESLARAGVSALEPLRQPVFRALWIASLTSNIGTWMQNVGAAWLMTCLTPSPVVVALVQAATSLPVFLVGLPAGALADIVDRRRLLIVSQGWMLLSAAALGVLTLIAFMSPWILLALTFALGLAAAMNTPAWQAIVPEVVWPSELEEAVALNAAGFNVARAVGPALGGLIVGAAGPGPVFLLNAASFIAVMLAVEPTKSYEPIARRARDWRYASGNKVCAKRSVFTSCAGALGRFDCVCCGTLGASSTGSSRSVRSRCHRRRCAARVFGNRCSRRNDPPTAHQTKIFIGYAGCRSDGGLRGGHRALAYVQNVFLVGAAMGAGGVAWIA